MSDLDDLYQELILDHKKNPRNFRRIENAGGQAEGFNRICGDRLTVYVDVENGRVCDIGFDGSGCAISTASASLMSEAVKGKTIGEVRDLFTRFHRMVTGDPTQAADDESLGKLAALGGVRKYPVRVKCATLAWHTLDAAMNRRGEVVSTEENP